ncbi:cytochrome b [Pararhizobium antarcticum]|nr:cytochrome b [Pararhizobium antarcticum]
MTTIAQQTRLILHYDSVARGIHWLMAALIVGAFGLGLLVDTFPSSWEDGVVNAHKLVGISILCLVVLRLVWRDSHTPPATEPSGWPLERVSSLSHIVLYCLMMAVPLIGSAFAVWSGQGIDFGLFSLAPVMPENEAVAHQIGEIHELAAYILICLAGLHALAALWHHFVRKDDVLRRMLPPQ